MDNYFSFALFCYSDLHFIDKNEYENLLNMKGKPDASIF